MSAVSRRESFHLHDCRNDRVRKNGLGSISIATSFRDNLPFRGEDLLVLFTMAACVYTNVSRHATHWIRQENLEQDSYFEVNKRNLIVFDDQMIDASKDKQIVNLFTRGSHHRNLNVHQGKGSRSISLNSHFLVLFKNPRDKLQILTLAKQMYPGQNDLFLNQYEEAVKRPFGYLLIDRKTTTQDSCRLRTNVLPSEEGFNQAGFQENIPQELLKYLKQQTLSPVPLLPAMEEIQGKIDEVLSRNDLRDDKKLNDTFSCKTDTWLLKNT